MFHKLRIQNVFNVKQNFHIRFTGVNGILIQIL